MAVDFKKLEKHNENIDNYHKSRVAFLIVDGEVKTLKKSTMSHFEWAGTIGIDEAKFRTLTRGYFLGNNMVFYRNNFEYDDDVISDAKRYAKKICNLVGVEDCDVYCGVEVGVGVVWPPLFFVGKASQL